MGFLELMKFFAKGSDRMAKKPFISESSLCVTGTVLGVLCVTSLDFQIYAMKLTL
jgi:hypothetical protein